MDTRTGQLYQDLASAVNAGVPKDQVAEVEVAGEILEVKNGPFVGRKYEVVNGKRGRRRKDLESA